ncbi:melanopsin-like [Oculina patagonica]
MDSNRTSWLLYSFSGNSSSYFNNHTKAINPFYIFTPAGVMAKRLLGLILLAIGGIGFLGNYFIFLFLCKQRRRRTIHTSCFVVNLNLYIRSLSLSDLLSCAVSLPLLCIQILFDVFQSGWPCKVVRYLNFMFPAVTVNNLVVISLEKYLSTRKVPRTFRAARVRKMIICAWVLGITVMLVPAVSYDGVRVDLNNTHFTVICSNVENFYPFKIALIIFPIQYIFPSVLIIYINFCLIKTVWASGRREIGNGVNNAFKANLVASRIKGTSLLIALTFAFIIPYLSYIGNVAYTQIAKPQRAFATDFLIRYACGGIAAYFSSAINFLIYFVQIKDFRSFLIKLWRGKRARVDDTSQTQVPRSRLSASKRQVDTVELVDLKKFNWYLSHTRPRILIVNSQAA